MTTELATTAIAAMLEKITSGEWAYDVDSECVITTEFHNGEQLTWIVLVAPKLPVGATDLAQEATLRFSAAAPAITRQLLDQNAELQREVKRYEGISLSESRLHTEVELLSRQLAEALAENKRYETNLIHCMERVTQLEAASKSEGGPA